jgi:hypothetical protein
MMSPLLIAGLVVVCLAALYYFDLFGAKKSTNKKLRELCMRIPADKFRGITFGIRTADPAKVPNLELKNIKCAPDEIAGATFEYDKVNKRMNRVLKCYKKGQLPKHMLHLRKDETNDHIMPTGSPLPVRGDESLVPHGVGSYEMHVSRARYSDPWDRM